MSEAAIAKKSKRQARERTCILGRIRPLPCETLLDLDVRAAD
jgi:hypothetical protein